MFIKLVMPSNHLILCHPLFLLPSIFPSIRVFSNESALCIRWPNYWSFNFNISPANEHPRLISFQSKGLSRVFSNNTVQKHQFFGSQFSSVAQSCPNLCDPMDCSTPGFPVHHQVLETTQIHVHRVRDAIQPSPLSSPSPPAPQSLPASGSFPMSQLFT